MSKFAGPHNKTNLGQVPKVAKVFWSRKRAYHGDEVTLSVRTELVPNGAAAELRIFPKNGGVVVDTITGVSVKGAKIDHKYKIEWKDKKVPPGEQEFVFTAVIDKLVSSLSPILFVDLEPPEMSA